MPLAPTKAVSSDFQYAVMNVSISPRFHASACISISARICDSGEESAAAAVAFARREGKAKTTTAIRSRNKNFWNVYRIVFPSVGAYVDWQTQRASKMPAAADGATASLRLFA